MLSIIVPTLNEEKYVPALLTSLRAQKEVSFEVIVADAGSRDRTVEIARAAGATIVAGGSPGAGRNRGAAAAKSELLLFLDADVQLSSPTFIADCLAEFKERSLDIATTEVDPLSDDTVVRSMLWAYNRFLRSTERVFPHAPGFFILVRRSLHEKISGFDETVCYAEDEDYARRADEEGAFGILRCNKILVSARRFERDGRLITAARNVAAELYIRTRGPIRTDFLKYRFGYDGLEKRSP